MNINGALGVLINITGGSNMTLWEVNEAATIIQEAAGERVNVIFGMVVDDSLSDELRVTVIATGFNKEAKLKTDLELPKAAAKGYEPINFTELDKPTFIRRQKEEKPSGLSPLVNKPSKSNIYSLDDEDLPGEKRRSAVPCES